jgi:hypothetical protein
MSGIFLDLMESNANFTGSQWRAEFQAMKAIKIEFIAIRSVMSGMNSYTTQGCKMGHFESFYNSLMQPTACYKRVGSNAPGGTLGIILEQAMSAGIGVHFGGLMPSSRFRGPGGKKPEQVIQWYRDLANLQVQCALDVWEQFPQFRSVIKGFYTDLEESNLPDWNRSAAELATHYLNPIADDVKHRMLPDLKVWASPYAVYNFTLHNRTDGQEHGQLLNASGYAQFWGDVWAAAPAFDFIAPQDSMGWMGNTLPEVKASLTALRSVARSAKPARELWSNIEIFEGWPAPCNFPVKCGRHPASIERVVTQIGEESKIATTLISWSWAMISPSGYDTNASAVLYRDYARYLAGGGVRLKVDDEAQATAVVRMLLLPLLWHAATLDAAMLTDSALNVSEVLYHPEQTHGQHNWPSSNIGSPSVLRVGGTPGGEMGDTGALLASNDFYDLKGHRNSTLVRMHRSRNNGLDWEHTAVVHGIYWAELFNVSDDVYLLGTSGELHDPTASVVISRCAKPCDGSQWTTPAVLFGYTTHRHYHSSGAGLTVDGDRLYRELEIVGADCGGTSNLQPVMLTADLRCNGNNGGLLSPSCWTMSEPLIFHNAMLPPNKYKPGLRAWEEGTTFLTTGGGGGGTTASAAVQVMMRVDLEPVIGPLHAAVLLDFDGSVTGPRNGSLSFNRVVKFPSGCNRFTTRWHPASQRYYSMTNPSNTSGNCGQRNILALASSTDLTDWRICDLVLTDDTGLSPFESIAQTGFQYVHWQFDGNALIFLARAAYRGAANAGAANRLLFGRVERFVHKCAESGGRGS